MAEFKKLSAVEAVETVSETANVLIEENGVIKRAPKNEVGGSKAEKELVYEWNFSVDDEVYEIVENVNEDLSWLTKRQDDIGFEIVIENYGCDYRWSQEEGDHDYVFYENKTSTTSSAEVPCYNRYINIPFWADSSVIIKEMLNGYMSGDEIRIYIEDTDKEFLIQPWNFFNIYAGIHFNEGIIVVENGGVIEIGSDSNNPLKSVKIYKITR